MKLHFHILLKIDRLRVMLNSMMLRTCIPIIIINGLLNNCMQIAYDYTIELMINRIIIND